MNLLKEKEKRNKKILRKVRKFIKKAMREGYGAAKFSFGNGYLEGVSPNDEVAKYIIDELKKEGLKVETYRFLFTWRHGDWDDRMIVSWQ